MRHLRSVQGNPTLWPMTSTAVQRRKLAVEVRDLRKSYGDVQAVRGVSFEVRRGELRQ